MFKLRKDYDPSKPLSAWEYLEKRKQENNGIAWIAFMFAAVMFYCLVMGA